MQRGQVSRLQRMGAAAERFGRVLKELPLPFGDLLEMRVEMRGQLARRPVFAQSAHGKLPLERRRVPREYAAPISSPSQALSRQTVLGSTSRPEFHL